MKTHPIKQQTRGHLQVDLLTAIALIALAVLPLAFGFLHHRKLVRDATTRAIVMELIDGEMEVLVAGEYQAVSEGSQAFALRGIAVTNLPLGSCTLSRSNLAGSGIELALEWKPEGGRILQPVRRSVRIPAKQ